MHIACSHLIKFVTQSKQKELIIENRKNEFFFSVDRRLCAVSGNSRADVGSQPETRPEGSGPVCPVAGDGIVVGGAEHPRPGQRVTLRERHVIRRRRNGGSLFLPIEPGPDPAVRGEGPEIVTDGERAGDRHVRQAIGRPSVARMCEDHVVRRAAEGSGRFYGVGDGYTVAVQQAPEVQRVPQNEQDFRRLQARASRGVSCKPLRPAAQSHRRRLFSALIINYLSNYVPLHLPPAIYATNN